MRLFATNDSWSLAILRLVLGVVIFPHGAQKALGWFGGHGFAATVQGMSGQFPTFLVYLAIAAEFLGSLGLIFGFLTRVAAFGIGCVMIVAVAKVHLANGFFMNWMGNQKGEGFEYHLLVLGIVLVLMIWGAGAASIDRAISRGRTARA